MQKRHSGVFLNGPTSLQQAFLVALFLQEIFFFSFTTSTWLCLCSQWLNQGHLCLRGFISEHQVLYVNQWLKKASELSTETTLSLRTCSGLWCDGMWSGTFGMVLLSGWHGFLLFLLCPFLSGWRVPWSLLYSESEGTSRFWAVRTVQEHPRPGGPSRFGVGAVEGKSSCHPPSYSAQSECPRGSEAAHKCGASCPSQEPDGVWFAHALCRHTRAEALPGHQGEQNVTMCERTTTWMSAGEGAERGGPPALWVGMEVGAAPVENSQEVPQQTENRVTTRIQQPHSWCIPRKSFTLKRYTPVFRAALLTTIKTWKQPKCPSTDECLRWNVYRMKYYSSIKIIK